MKKITLIFLCLSTLMGFSQNHSIVWEENFNGYAIPSGVEGISDGSTTNNFANMGDYDDAFSKWTINADNASLQNFSDYAAVFRTSGYLDSHFRVQDTHGNEITTPEGGYVEWVSENIDISNYDSVSVSMYLEETGDHEVSDYIDVFFSTDNGSNYEQLNNWNNLGNSDHTLVGDVVTPVGCNQDADFMAGMLYFSISGSPASLKLKVRFKNGATSENFIMDDVRIMGLDNRLSVANHTKEDFKIFPNPTKGSFLNIQASSNLNDVSFYDINGRLIFLKSNLNTNQMQLNTGSIENGFYLVTITDLNNSRQTKKLIINN